MLLRSRDCLTRLTASGAPALEIIVADASAEPARSAIVRCCAAAGVRLLLCPVPSRGSQMNAGAAAAGGDILVFSHADTELHPAHLAAITTAMAEPTALAGAFHKDLRAHYPLFAWAAPVVRWWTRRFGLIYGDQSLFLRRPAFLALGGFADIPIMEDIDLSQRLRRQLTRRQFVLLDPPLRTSMRRFHRRGALRTRIENICLVWLWRLHLLTPAHIHQWYYRAR